MNGNLNSTALSATLHCLTGCAIGEISGLTLGLIFGWSNIVTVAAAIGLAFLFGYALSSSLLLKAGLSFKQAVPIILAADTLSILTMEVVDNAVVIAVPGAMDAGIVSPLFWSVLSLALFTAFWAAFPVNRWLLKRGKGHALVHEFHHGSGHQ